jgi:3-deoxy-D-manno-octulosonic-acid transferase
VLVNARISDRSYARLQTAPWLVHGFLLQITRALASSADDRERLAALGYPDERLETTGNIKLDVTVAPVLQPGERARLRDELGLGGDELVLMGSSTWPGEEEALVDALRRARSAGIAARLLIVPRHAERRSEIGAMLDRSEFRWHLRSRGPADGTADACLADTTGEMVKLLQVADVVFVGRSIAPNNGGQTPVESAALGRPILFGPNMTNFRVIAQRLVEAGAARVVADARDLVDESVRLLRDPADRQAMADAARAWHAANRGAVEHTIRVIEHILAGSESKSAEQRA